MEITAIILNLSVFPHPLGSNGYHNRTCLEGGFEDHMEQVMSCHIVRAIGCTAAAIVNVTLLKPFSTPFYAGIGPFPDWVCIRAPKLQFPRYVV